jgi:hypothetical protein
MHTYACIHIYASYIQQNFSTALSYLHFRGSGLCNLKFLSFAQKKLPYDFLLLCIEDHNIHKHKIHVEFESKFFGGGTGV